MVILREKNGSGEKNRQDKNLKKFEKFEKIWKIWKNSKKFENHQYQLTLSHNIPQP